MCRCVWVTWGEGEEGGLRGSCWVVLVVCVWRLCLEGSNTKDRLQPMVPLTPPPVREVWGEGAIAICC